MLSKAMIFLCLLPFLTVFLFTVTSLFMGLLGVMLFEGKMLKRDHLSYSNQTSR